MPPIGGDLLGENVGRVRTSRQDSRERKGPWRKKNVIYESESEIQFTQWCRRASCRNSYHPEQLLACEQNIQLVDACSRWS